MKIFWILQGHCSTAATAALSLQNVSTITLCSIEARRHWFYNQAVLKERRNSAFSYLDSRFHQCVKITNFSSWKMVDRKTILSPKFELKGKFLEIFFLAPSLGLKKELSVLISQPCHSNSQDIIPSL